MTKKKAKNLKQGDVVYLSKGDRHTIRGVIVNNAGVRITADAGRQTKTITYHPDQLIEVE